jgi:hypothetical protein
VVVAVAVATSAVAVVAGAEQQLMKTTVAVVVDRDISMQLEQLRCHNKEDPMDCRRTLRIRLQRATSGSHLWA